jgi:hypothetical protein
MLLAAVSLTSGAAGLFCSLLSGRRSAAESRPTAGFGPWHGRSGPAAATASMILMLAAMADVMVPAFSFVPSVFWTFLLVLLAPIAAWGHGKGSSRWRHLLSLHHGLTHILTAVLILLMGSHGMGVAQISASHHHGTGVIPALGMGLTVAFVVATAALWIVIARSWNGHIRVAGLVALEGLFSLGAIFSMIPMAL